MECCLTYCLEMLISLSEDDNEEISTNSRNTLELVSRHNLHLTLVDILAENFYGVITRLPRIINGTGKRCRYYSISCGLYICFVLYRYT